MRAAGMSSASGCTQRVEPAGDFGRPCPRRALQFQLGRGRPLAATDENALSLPVSLAQAGE